MTDQGGYTEDRMKELLAAHLLPEGRRAAGVLATGIQSPDGKRVADGIWAPFGHGRGLEGYEIKVSRADVQVELADQLKSDPWLRYCTRWWLFVSDPAFVVGLDVPLQWGVVAPPSGRKRRTLTVVKDAPVLHPVETGPAWQRINTWNSFRRTERITEMETQIRRLTGQVMALKQHERTCANVRKPEASRAYELMQHLIARVGEERLYASVQEIGDAFVEVILDHVAASRNLADRVRDAQNLMLETERLLGRLRGGYVPDGVKARIAAITAADAQRAANRP